MLLIEHFIQCCHCKKYKNHKLFSNTNKKKSDNKKRCIDCINHIMQTTYENNLQQRLAVFECVVCGNKISNNKSANASILSIKTKHRKRSVCSDKCLVLYDKAIEYIKNLHGVHKTDAVNIFSSTYFSRSLKQYEKNIRL